MKTQHSNDRPKEKCHERKTQAGPNNHGHGDVKDKARNLPPHRLRRGRWCSHSACRCLRPKLHDMKYSMLKYRKLGLQPRSSGLRHLHHSIVLLLFVCCEQPVTATCWFDQLANGRRSGYSIISALSSAIRLSTVQDAIWPKKLAICIMTAALNRIYGTRKRQSRGSGAYHAI
jgi:hypothetical protein